MSNNSLFYENVNKDYNAGKGLSGLVNLGNTCYMNTCIQCISNIPVLTNYFLSEKYKEDINIDCIEHKLVLSWIDLLKGIWGENCTIAPGSFYKIISYFSRTNGIFFGSGEHQDLSEFLSFFIDTMHKSLKQEVEINIRGSIRRNVDKMAVDAMTMWKNYFKNDYSIFVGGSPPKCVGF